MNLKKQRVIHTLMIFSLIFYIAYLVSALVICFLPKSVSIFISVPIPDDFVMDWAQILGLFIAALLFFLSYFLCRNKIKTHSKSPLPAGILLILSAAIIEFVLPAVVILFRYLWNGPFVWNGPIVSRSRITQGVYTAWMAVNQEIGHLSILMYPALLLLFVAYSVYWIDAKTDDAAAMQ